MPKPGNRAANRVVIRFVIAKLKAATQRLRNRIRRMGPARIARSKMTAVVLGMSNYLLLATVQSFVRQQLGRGLLQLRVLGFGLLKDGDVGVGVFPEGEEVLVGCSGLVCVAFQSVGSGEAKVGQRSQ
jgi:hypothetical protein